MSLHSLINMIIVTYLSVLLHFSGAIGDYNYVLERYSIEPTSSWILKSKLCRLFKTLSICDEYSQNRRDWNRITPIILESYSNSLKKRQALINKWHKNCHCECKCCTCPKTPKVKPRNLYSENYEPNLPFRKRKFKGQKQFYIPLVRKKYESMNRRRKLRHTKRFNLDELVNSVKDTAKNTYEKAGKGIRTVEDSAKNTYHNAINSFVKAGGQVHEVLEDVKIATGIETRTMSETCATFLLKMNKKLESMLHNNIIAQWNYEIDLSDINRNHSIEADTNFSKLFKEMSVKVTKFDERNNCSLIDPLMCREFSFLTNLQESALSSENYGELQDILKHMETMFSKATVRSFHDDSIFLRLEPGITNVMAYSRNPDELKYIWESWRNETGKKFKMFYPRYVVLLNRAAKMNGFSNAADMWLSVYQKDDFEEIIFEIWKQIKPLYQKLHAYVRHKLRVHYGAAEITDEYIPAHLLGNVFGQTWVNLYNITMPFNDQVFPDITTQLQTLGYTPKRMVEVAENFFTSLNLSQMTEQFWRNSIFETNRDVEMVCHASAWDMFDIYKHDYRIKMCAHVTFEDFIVTHHEMGHIEYYMLYNHLPVVFREGANPGFHEAIGDTIALSVSTPEHMKSLGFEVENEHNHMRDINFLFFVALQKIAFLPYALVVESWRWRVFRGEITLQNYNEHWWNLRREFQGVKPPEPRTEDNFDPGSKYHIAAGVPYIRYFVSFVIQFQFHEALCRRAGKLHEHPLHNCDIYKSTEAGALLKETLSLGKSVHWCEVMMQFTGNNISANSLLQYFKPLERWLETANQQHKLDVGWDIFDNVN